jgi:group I intron endonuclease
MAIVYRIKNKINGKSYIGMTVRSFEERYNGHLSSARQGSKFRFHSAIRKYGVDSWEHEILEESDDIAYIRKREEEYIEEYKTIFPKYGYNAKPGGCGGWIVFPENYDKWVNKVKERTIGEKNPRFCGVTNDELYEIVKGESIKLGRIPGYKYILSLYPYLPKSFSKYRFNGSYKNLAILLEKETGLKFIPSYKTEEHRRKISEFHRGRKLTKEHVENIQKGLRRNRKNAKD